MLGVVQEVIKHSHEDEREGHRSDDGRCKAHGARDSADVQDWEKGKPRGPCQRRQEAQNDEGREQDAKEEELLVPANVVEPF